MEPPLLLAVMGPTASGKTDLAEWLAEELDARLINADAFQVYRGMDIGTAKSENRSQYKLLDLIEPNENFGLGEWLRLAVEELEELFAASRTAIVVGGTGLYIRALTEQYQEIWPAPDPELRAHLAQRLESEGLAALYEELRRKSPSVAAKTDEFNPHRVCRALEKVLSNSEPARIQIPPFRVKKLALDPENPEHILRIQTRTEEMMRNGWIGEVSNLMACGFGPGDPGFRAHGYSQIWRMLRGEMTSDEALSETVKIVTAYSKRQRTWMRSEPRLKVVPADTDRSEIFDWITSLKEGY